MAHCTPPAIHRDDPRLLRTALHRRPDKLIVAIANPWSPLAEEYLAPRFPDLEIVKIVTLASEIARAIESVATNNGPSRSELEAIDVEDIDDGIHDFDVTTDYTEPMAQSSPPSWPMRSERAPRTSTSRSRRKPSTTPSGWTATSATRLRSR
jgi:hypothetical protein